MTKSLKHSEDISFSKSLRLAKTIASRIGKFEEELNEILSEHDLGVPMRRAGEDPFSRIEHIFNRFKVVARQFERRHDSR